MSPFQEDLLTDRPRLAALTFLRYLAALWVLTFHMNAGGGLRWAPTWLQGLTSRGYVAVTFFFMLSGFILVYTYGGRELDLKRFWNARLARLYPVYLFSTLLLAPIFLFGVLHHPPFPGMEWFGHHLGLSAVLVLTMQQAWVPLAALGWNGVCWAVSAEVFFYILFPLLLRRMTRMSLGQLAAVALLAWLAALAAAGLYIRLRPDGLAMTAWVMPDGLFWLQALKFNPLVRLPEFIAGMACGVWFLRGGHASQRSSQLIGAGVALLAIILALASRIPYPLMHTGLTAPAFAAILCGFALRPAWSDFTHSRLCTRLGESSYSLYLLHGLVVGIVLFMPVGPIKNGMPPSPSLIRSLLGIVLSTGFGVLILRYVEEPLRKKIRFGHPKG